jgi:hypothetical protein
MSMGPPWTYFYIRLWGFYDEELAKNKQEVGRPMSKHLKIERRSNLHIMFLCL